MPREILPLAWRPGDVENERMGNGAAFVRVAALDSERLPNLSVTDLVSG